MDSERLKELRRLAERATQGPWKVGLHKNFVYEFQDNVLLFETVGKRTTQTERMNNADFIAAANPATILQLLDEIEALQAEVIKQLSCDGIPLNDEKCLKNEKIQFACKLYKLCYMTYGHKAKEAQHEGE